MSNLYELSKEIQSLQNAFESGEIPEGAFNDILEGFRHQSCKPDEKENEL